MSARFEKVYKTKTGKVCNKTQLLLKSKCDMFAK